LKRRVRDSLVRLLLSENLASPESSSSFARGGGEAGDRGEGGGGVDADVASAADQAVAGEEGEEGRAARASRTWQRALDQVLLDLEELVALESDTLVQDDDDPASAPDFSTLALSGVEGSPQEIEGSEGDGGARVPGIGEMPAAARGSGRTDDDAMLGAEDFPMYMLQRPHSVVTLMVALAQPKTRAAQELLEKFHASEESQTIRDCFECLEELVYSDAIPGNVMRVQLLWTAEPEHGFEKEDILSFRRLERLYPEVEREKERRKEKEFVRRRTLMERSGRGRQLRFRRRGRGRQGY
jgi:hypothetical protein